MRKLMIAVAGTSFLMAGCAEMGDGGPEPAPMADMTPEARGPYVMMAGASDLYEIRSGQLAQQKAQRPEIREFGRMLVAHHTETTRQVTAAARASGMNPPPPRLMPMHRSMMRDLRQASGAAFDQVFLRQQATAHQMALDLHSNYSRAGDAPALRAAASGAVPVVTQHLERVRQLD